MDKTKHAKGNSSISKIIPRRGNNALYVMLITVIPRFQESLNLCRTMVSNCSLNPLHPVSKSYPKSINKRVILSVKTIFKDLIKNSTQSWYKGNMCSVIQLYPTLCDSMDCTPRGSSIHVIFQKRILEWGAISYSRGSS